MENAIVKFYAKSVKYSNVKYKVAVDYNYMNVCLIMNIH